MNRRASIALVAVLAAVLLGLGFFIGVVWVHSSVGDVVVIGLFAGIAAVWSLISYFAGGSIVLAESGARELTYDPQSTVWNVIAEMSIAAGLPLPKVYLIDDPAPSALSTGRDPRHAAVAVTSGLLAMMDRQELQGVVAHEIAHVRNYDILLATLTSVIVGVITITGAFFLHLSLTGFRLAAAFGRASGRRQSQAKDGGGALFFLPAIIALVLAAVLALLSALVARAAHFLARLVQLAISRRREYLADASAVELSRDPLALADALAKIAAYGGSVRAASQATAHLYIANPFAQLAGSLGTLFDTHPPIEKRIAILRVIGHQSPAADVRWAATVPRQAL
ncbi:MAG: M48 family metallopeptidase [Thermoleophilia bacterium]